MQHKLIILLFGLIGIQVQLLAQTPPPSSSFSDVTCVSPFYFGPNAFPIPDMLDGRVSSCLRVELCGDYFIGKRGDNTENIALKVNVPLWTDRVNLSLWMPVVEWYQNSAENMDACNVTDENRESALKGTLMGDLYVSADIQVFKEKVYWPDVAVRAAIKTASGGGYSQARYYDAPGYFFDASIGKSLALGGSVWRHKLRVAASAGFLCWQTNVGRQNDAIQYGLMLKWENRYFSLSQTLGGYSGWEHITCNGKEIAYDSPMSLKTNLSVYYKMCEFLLAYQYGLRDYPYHQLRLGVAYSFDILKKKTSLK
jgi:hypothetical protein